MYSKYMYNVYFVSMMALLFPLSVCPHHLHPLDLRKSVIIIFRDFYTCNKIVRSKFLISIHFYVTFLQLVLEHIRITSLFVAIMSSIVTRHIHVYMCTYNNMPCMFDCGITTCCGLFSVSV